ncbi:MAG: sugar transferase [Sphingorhabdus sp.]
MKVAITGSTGFVGQELVPLLEQNAYELVLIGRDLDRVKYLYPGRNCCDYSNLQNDLEGVDIVIHLAVLNNNKIATDLEFYKVNVQFALDIAQKSAAAGVKKFVNIGSLQELSQTNLSPYAQSKKYFSHQVAMLEDIEVINLYAPYIYGSKWGGKLDFLNKIPKCISKFLFYFIKSIWPTVSVDKVYQFIDRLNYGECNNEIIICDDIGGNHIYSFSKKLIDLSFAFFVISLLFWLFLLIWLAVQLESGAPGIFSQQRVGREGKIFNCYKFRTMKQSTVQLGTHEVPASAVTRLGKFLRSTKLDELPQVWNILRDEISLVGPRPSLPVQTLLVEERRKRGVLSVTPGITGLAQINDVDMSDPNLLAQWDERYVASRSLLLDIKIIMSTFLGSGKGDRVKID